MNTTMLRKAIRQAAKCVGSTVPIVFVDGDSAPKYVGHSWHYRNSSGHLIRYPNAYRRAWGKPIYYHSTQRIEVGMDWPMHVGLTARPVKTA